MPYLPFIFNIFYEIVYCCFGTIIKISLIVAVNGKLLAHTVKPFANTT